MRNHTQIQNERLDQMHELARWDRQGHPLNANAAMAEAWQKIDRLRAQQSDPADLNKVLQGLAKFGADNPNSRQMIENGWLKSKLQRYINRADMLEKDRAEIRRQRDEAWDRIEELENSNV